MNYVEWLKHMNSTLSSDRSHAADEIPDDGDIIEINSLLINALDDEDDLVRTCAADSLAAIPSESTRAALRASLKSEQNELVLSYVVHSLGTVGDASDITRISEVNTFAQAASQFSTACGEAIIELGVRIGTEQLFLATQSTDHKVSAGSLNALARTTSYLIAGVERAREIAKINSRDNNYPMQREAIAKILEISAKVIK